MSHSSSTPRLPNGHPVQLGPVRHPAWFHYEVDNYFDFLKWIWVCLKGIIIHSKICRAISECEEAQEGRGVGKSHLVFGEIRDRWTSKTDLKKQSLCLPKLSFSRLQVMVSLWRSQLMEVVLLLVFLNNRRKISWLPGSPSPLQLHGKGDRVSKP